MKRLAICGLGNIGSVHLENLRSLPNCEISGVFDLSAKVAARFSSEPGINFFPSIEAMMSDPGTDAIVIATPTQTHRSLTLLALAHGKHVFLEKPIAGSLEDAEAICDAAKNSSLCVQVGFCERFNPQHIEAKRHVTEGALGKVRAIYSSRVAPYSLGDPGWELGIFDTAVHNIDLILWLFDREPESVEVSAVRLYPDASGRPHSAAITLRFSDGAIATDHITWLQDDRHPLHQCARSRMSILGEEGSFEIDLSQRPSALLTKSGFHMPDTVLLGASGYYGCLKLQFESFLRSVAQGHPVMAPVEDALQAERVILAVIKSLQQNSRVYLT